MGFQISAIGISYKKTLFAEPVTYAGLLVGTILLRVMIIPQAVIS